MPDGGGIASGTALGTLATHGHRCSRKTGLARALGRDRHWRCGQDPTVRRRARRTYLLHACRCVMGRRVKVRFSRRPTSSTACTPRSATARSEARFRPLTSDAADVWSACRRLPRLFNAVADYTAAEGETDGERWANVFPEASERVAQCATACRRRGYEIHYRSTPSGDTLGAGRQCPRSAGGINPWLGTCTVLHEQRLRRRGSAASARCARPSRKDEFWRARHELRNPLALSPRIATLLLTFGSGARANGRRSDRAHVRP